MLPPINRCAVQLSKIMRRLDSLLCYFVLCNCLYYVGLDVARVGLGSVCGACLCEVGRPCLSNLAFKSCVLMTRGHFS